MSAPTISATLLCRLVPVLRLVLIAAIGCGWVLPRSAAAQVETERGDDPLAASTVTVNVELILDASGSMAELLPDSENQSRMEAAKAAMRDVIAQFPQRDGLNVGFRVYGHEGSSDEADRAASCRSTELLVPLDGVDRDALLTQVETFEPTGWTPLALALQEAAADFTAGESVTNAIIMVTDGEDTCGGDPCAVAGELHAADVALTTHVVGFALTGEQRRAVRCIAEEGGGELFAADDAQSLSEAVFSALARVEATPVPVETRAENEVRGYIGGNAFSLLNEGAEGELSVVAVGPYDGSHIPIVVQNRTGADVEEITVDALARVNGELAATGNEEYLTPQVVVDGGLAFGDVYFGEDLPADTAFEFELSAEPAAEDEASTRDLVVEEVNGTDSTVVGILRNAHDVTIGDVVIDTAIACFDADGHLLDYGFGGADKTSIGPDETTSFEYALPQVSGGLETDTCPLYLVTGNGYVVSV